MSDPRFLRAFGKVIRHEGGLSLDPNDLGNWTSGRIGRGTLKGTKYGVSAASYPELDIANLTLADAHAIYERDYWARAGCPGLPDGVAYSQFDAAVNIGAARAVRFLQAAVGAGPDGIIGPITRQKIAARDPDEILRDMLAIRVEYYMSLDELNDRYGLGWARRSVDVVIDGIRIIDGDDAPNLARSADHLLAAYMAHEDVPEGSMRYKIAAALREG